MYIKKVEITNIRSIDHFAMTFDNPAGWHVLIGDNGSGKSSIVRSIALALIGREQALGLGRTSDWVDWSNWLRKGQKEGEILLEIISEFPYEHIGARNFPMGEKIEICTDSQTIYSKLKFKQNTLNDKLAFIVVDGDVDGRLDAENLWSSSEGWFSVAFGPQRRFNGGDNDRIEDPAKSNYNRLLAHLTVFDEKANLKDSIAWLKEKKFEQLEKKNNHLDIIREFINASNFLPYNAKLNEVGSEGVTFIDGNGVNVFVDELSDGFRSMIGLIFELLRQIFIRYNIPILKYENEIFLRSPSGEIIIDVPGVVLIDEIDAHLHPTWQTRIGQWFTKYFPKMQFIVTTHSPLICRACEKGTIWRLVASDSDSESGEVTGIDRQRLIYGNVLDAYGTEVFGEDVSQSISANEMLKELADLNAKSFKGIISEDEKKRMRELKTILPTS